MSEINERAQKIFKRQQEKSRELETKKILVEEERKKKIEKYVEKILDVFEVLQLEENSTSLVWQVHLFINGKHLDCQVSFKESDLAVRFYRHNLTTYRKLQNSMDDFNRLEIPIDMAKDICEYFDTNLGEYFFTTQGGTSTIQLKKGTNCENMEFKN